MTSQTAVSGFVGARLTGGRLAALAAGAAIARVLLFARLDRRPRFGGSEPSDLCNLMQHHYGVHGYIGESILTRIAEGGYKPPAYYAGVPALLGWKSSLDLFSVLAFNALALAMLALALWVLGRRLGGPWCATWTVLIGLALPAVAGRATIVGVEIAHMAVLAWVFIGGLALTTTNRRWRDSVGLGLLIGLGLLMKWTLAFALVGPFCVLLWWAIQRDRDLLKPLAVVTLGATAVFVLWWIPLGSLDKFVAALASEINDADEMVVASWLYLPKWAVEHGIGWAAAPIVLLCILKPGVPRDSSGRLDRLTSILLGSSVVTLLLIHTLIPHKEVRYLLPVFVPIALLLGFEAAKLDKLGGKPQLLLRTALLWALLATFVAPTVGAHLDGPPDRLIEARLRLYTDPVDLGLPALVQHPSLTAVDPAVVSYALEGNRWIELRDMLSWEFYSRNDRPVVSRLHPLPSLQEPIAATALENSTHFVVNRPLTPADEATLNQFGYREALKTSIAVPEGEDLRLWVRSPAGVPELEKAR